MTEPLQLWTAGDIARELGLSQSTVYNWSYRGRHYMPKPYAMTQKGLGQGLWTAEQVKRVIASYYKRQP